MSTDIQQRLAAAGIAGALPILVMFEGISLPAYLDPIGIPTICRGHTGDVRLGDIATPMQCDEYTVRDLLKAKATMESCMHTPLNDNQRAAFVSFVYNVGGGKKGVKDGFCVLKTGRPTTMVIMLNAGNITGACNQLPYWVGAKGKILNGLIKRRAVERAICLKEPT